MPEFIMNDRNEAAEAEKPFVLGFIEAMLFTETSPCYSSEEWSTPECQKRLEEGQTDGCLPNDVGYMDLHPEALASIRAFCERKQAEMASLLDTAYETCDYDEEQAGRDLWFTYNGHGVGYWSRDALEENGLGDRLSEACGRGEIYPFFGGHVALGDAPFIHVDLY